MTQQYGEEYAYGWGYDKEFDGVFLQTSSSSNGYVIKYNSKLDDFELYKVDINDNYSLKLLKGYNLYGGCEDPSEIIVDKEYTKDDYFEYDLSVVFHYYKNLPALL